MRIAFVAAWLGLAASCTPFGTEPAQSDASSDANLAPPVEGGDAGCLPSACPYGQCVEGRCVALSFCKLSSECKTGRCEPASSLCVPNTPNSCRIANESCRLGGCCKGFTCRSSTAETDGVCGVCGVRDTKCANNDECCSGRCEGSGDNKLCSP